MRFAIGNGFTQSELPAEDPYANAGYNREQYCDRCERSGNSRGHTCEEQEKREQFQSSELKNKAGQSSFLFAFL